MPFRYNPLTGELDFSMGPGTGTASIEFTTDSGTVNPTMAGVITITGGTDLTTSGAGSTITIDIDAPISVASGGTGRTSLTDGTIIVGDGTSQVELIGPLTDGQLLIGDTAGVSPVASTLTAGTGISITNGAGSITIDATGAVPTTFQTDGGSAVPSLNVLTIAGGTGLTTSGAGSTVTIDLDTPVSVANGGTGAASLTDGGIVLGSGTGAVTVTAQPTNGQVLIGSTGVDPVLATLTGGTGLTVSNGAGTITIDLDTPVSVSNGGTGAASLTDGGILLGSGTGAITATSQPTDGQLLIGSTGVDPVLATLTDGNGITTTLGAGSITIDADVASGGSSTDNALARWSGTGGDTLQDSTVIVSDNGEMTNASQPCFAATLTATASNVTGDGTLYQIAFDNEIFDQNGDFNTSTGVFTAPVTGKYLMSGTVSLTGLSSSYNDYMIQLDMSNNTNQQAVRVDPSALDNSSGTNFSFARIVDMDASDTLNLNVQAGGSAKTVNVQGGNGLRYTCLTGALIC